MGAIISRFAPAPTGLMHLGHVVNAIYVWGMMNLRSGAVLLRIEDHDRQRSRAAFDAAILQDLEWLGFAWDGAVVRQSARGDIYAQMLERLRAQGRVYACACTRSAVARRLQPSDPHQPSEPLQSSAAPPPTEPLAPSAGEPRYPGTCRDRGVAEAPGVGIRVRLDDTVERFVDLRHGPQQQRPSDQCGDLLVRDREGNWTYQFVAAVDDYLQRVSHVIRGDDLLASTGRQLQLARLLGRPEPPVFLHHPLVMKSPTQKLSKSDNDTAIGALRAGGWSAERVIGRAAWLGRLTREPREIAAREVAGLFG